MKENIWTIIGSIAGVLAVIFTVWFFYQGRSDQSKKLEVELFARSSLVDENVSRTKQRIEIFYDGREIPNFVILQFRVANTGSQPIRNSDYEEPLWLHFDDVTEILSAEQVSSDPKQLQIKPAVCSPRLSPGCQKEGVSALSVWLPPTLLNPRDWYILEVGIAPESGKKPVPEVKGRIAGVKQIVFKETIPPPTKGRDQPEVLSIIGAICSAIVLLVSAYFKIREDRIRSASISARNKV